MTKVWSLVCVLCVAFLFAPASKAAADDWSDDALINEADPGARLDAWLTLRAENESDARTLNAVLALPLGATFTAVGLASGLDDWFGEQGDARLMLSSIMLFAGFTTTVSGLVGLLSGPGPA